MLCSCDLHEKLAGLHYNQGVKKADAGDLTGALDDFSAAIAQNPKYADAYAYRGYVLLLCSNYVAALKDLNKVIELKPDYAWAYLNRGIALEDLDDPKGALTNYDEAVRLDPDDADGWKSRGSVRTDLRDWDGALADLNRAVSLKSDDADVYDYRAHLQNQRDEYESAIADASKAIGLNDKDGYAYETRGTARMLSGDSTNALADYEMAISIDARDANAFVGRGMVKVYMGELDGAEKDLDHAIQLDPTNTFALGWISALKVKRGDLSGAIDALTNSVAIEASLPDPDAYESIGWLQWLLHRDDAALASCRKALEIDARMNDARFGIWLIRSAHGGEAEASKELRAGMAAHPPDLHDEWESCIGHFLVGDLAETNFLSQALTTARRATDRDGQLCQARYYAGMKHLFAGDRAGAIELLQQCVASHQDNEAEYTGAVVELRELKGE